MLRNLALSLAVLATSCVRAEQSPPAQPNPAPEPAVPVPTVVAPAKKTPPGGRITFTQCHVDGPFAAITFDDGPHGAQTPRLLKMLKDRGIKSTFFVVGQCVAEYPEIARQIVAEGHELANHSWNHPLLSKMGEDSVRDQLQRTHDVVKQEAGVSMTLMRPPYGGFTTNQRAWAFGSLGYQCILWDVDSLDWKHRTPAKTQAIILSEAKPGSIILCHDIHKTTIDAMPATLDALQAKGLKLVTVSELIKMHKEPASGSPAAKPARALTPKEGAAAATSLQEIQKPVPTTVPAAVPGTP